jgi:hypothetical protein
VELENSLLLSSEDERSMAAYVISEHAANSTEEKRLYNLIPTVSFNINNYVEAQHTRRNGQTLFMSKQEFAASPDPSPESKTSAESTSSTAIPKSDSLFDSSGAVYPAVIEAANARGFKVVEVTGDGHCLFRAVAYLLAQRVPHHRWERYANDLAHIIVRTEVKKYMLGHAGDFDEFVKALGLGDDTAHYVDHMPRWGGHPELRAMAMLYGTIDVWSPQHGMLQPHAGANGFPTMDRIRTDPNLQTRWDSQELEAIPPSRTSRKLERQ